MSRNPKQVKAHLKIWLLRGRSITQLQAFRLWKTTRLASYIFRLRDKGRGLKIKTTIVNAGTDSSYAKYKLT